MVDRIMFDNFSLPDQDGFFFLRPDKILCVMIIKDIATLTLTFELQDDVETHLIREREMDHAIATVLDKKEAHLLDNKVRIASAFASQARNLESRGLCASFAPSSADDLELSHVQRHGKRQGGGGDSVTEKSSTIWINPMLSDVTNPKNGKLSPVTTHIE
jgi:hypothetical protein